METNGTTIIGRPVDTVFAYVNDVTNDGNWRTGIDRSWLDPGETIGEGTIGHSGSGDMEIQWRVVKYVPGERIEWELLNGPFLGRGGYHLEPVEGGTRFTLLGEVEPTGFYKLLGPLFGWVGRRRNTADAEKLRQILESEPNVS